MKRFICLTIFTMAAMPEVPERCLSVIVFRISAVVIVSVFMVAITLYSPSITAS